MEETYYEKKKYKDFKKCSPKNPYLFIEFSTEKILKIFLCFPGVRTQTIHQYTSMVVFQNHSNV